MQSVVLPLVVFYIALTMWNEYLIDAWYGIQGWMERMLAYFLTDHSFQQYKLDVEKEKEESPSELRPNRRHSQKPW